MSTDSSQGKRCPFQKQLCNRKCALFTDPLNGCAILEIVATLNFSADNNWRSQGRLESIENIIKQATQKDDE